MSIDPRVTVVELYELARNRSLWSYGFFDDLESHGSSWLQLRDWCLFARGVQNFAEIPDPPAPPPELVEGSRSRGIFSRKRKPPRNPVIDGSAPPPPRKAPKKKQGFVAPTSTGGTLNSSVPLPAIIAGAVVIILCLGLLVFQLVRNQKPTTDPNAGGEAGTASDTQQSAAMSGTSATKASNSTGTTAGGAVLTAGGQAFSCIAEGEEVTCSGENSMGQLGTADLATARTFTFYLPTAARSLVAGDDFACASTSSEVWCWGDNRWAQTGHGNSEVTSPGPVVGVPGGTIKDIAAGRAHACALTDQGVWCWGVNTARQVKDSDDTYLSPTQVEGLDSLEITGIEASNFTTFVRTTRGVWAWGDNTRHQITSTDSAYLPPTQISEPTEGTGNPGGTGATQAPPQNGAPANPSNQRAQ